MTGFCLNCPFFAQLLTNLPNFFLKFRTKQRGGYEK